MTELQNKLTHLWRKLSGSDFLKQALLPVGAILMALLVGSIFMLIIGTSPLVAYSALLKSAFGDTFSIGETLESVTPLLLTGLAVAFAFQAKLFNIGAEGQFLMGALAASWVGVNLPLPPGIHIVVTLLVGAIVGGLWGGIAGLLKATRGVHEVISTIMLNHIALFFIGYMVTGPMKEVSPLDIPQTARVLPTAQLMKIMPPSRLSAGIIIALLVAAFIWWVLWKTTFGYEIRAVGQNPHAAEFSGIKPNRNIFLAMLVSGSLAGLGGAIIISGLFMRFQHGFEPGYGFTAIAISLLGGNNPPGIILAALLFATLSKGAMGMQNLAGVPQDIVLVIQALVIFFVAAPRILQILPKRRKRQPEISQTKSSNA